jgi:large subunit ribosomal protein L10
MDANTVAVKKARLPKDYKPKVSDEKKKAVDELVKLFNENKVVALVNLEGLPSAQLQRLKQQIRENVKIFMCKKTIMTLAFEQIKGKVKGSEKIAEMVTGMPALLLTNENPFKLANKIQKNKSKAPAKAGQIAPFDIIIPAGPTSFTPGPIISELAAAGIKAGVENGKIAVKVPSTLAKEGEEISKNAADMMAKFNIEPMEIGLNLVGALEDGIIYDKAVLSVEPETYINELSQAASDAHAIAIEIGFATPDTIKDLISSAARAAKGLAKEQGIMVPEIAEELIGQAEQGAKAIESMIDFSATEKKEEAPKEEPKEPSQSSDNKAEEKKEKPAKDDEQKA